VRLDDILIVPCTGGDNERRIDMHHDLYVAVYNRLSWTSDAKHGYLIPDEQAIWEVKDEIDKIIAEWIVTSKRED
jgi:hypothetical protein